MIGKCNKGADCTFSHGKGDAALTYGTAARQYFPRPQDLRRGDANALMDFNAALDNLQDAAMLNIRVSQLPRLQRQPEVTNRAPHGSIGHRLKSQSLPVNSLYAEIPTVTGDVAFTKNVECKLRVQLWSRHDH